VDAASSSQSGPNDHFRCSSSSVCCNCSLISCAIFNLNCGIKFAALLTAFDEFVWGHHLGRRFFCGSEKISSASMCTDKLG
jgi:hypothetical protein